MEKINNEIKSLPHGPAGSDEQVGEKITDKFDQEIFLF